MIEIPLKIVSVQNERTHWAARAKRVKSEREIVQWHLAKAGIPALLPCAVNLTRIAPRPLDGHDNLRHGFKPTVDAIAAWFGIKDNDPRIEWRYSQEKGKPKSYSIRIEFLATISSPTA